ncbi:hypothetical protein [Solidesulfovibrio sp.]|uniref:hypothetical protein n=1 Tax=Solidesulfovibrio sp. TaxID=2910990 RepID=UPI00262FA6C7|nr:hypothetical protein [Solidesulfovibrio sp.]
MDMRWAFTEFLFAFCLVVLADRVYGVFGRIGAALGLSRPLAAAGDALAAASPGDWYVFFSRDAVTGHPTITELPASSTGRPAAPRPRRDARPRLHAR